MFMQYNKYTNSYNIKTLSENSDGFINITLRASITNINDLEKLRKNLKQILGIEFAFYESPENKNEGFSKEKNLF